MKFTVKTNDAGKTLFNFLSKHLSDVPKSRLERAFRNKDIKLNNKRTKERRVILNEGDEIEIYGIESRLPKVRFRPIQINFNVIYEDKNILAVHKQPGVVTSGEKNSLDDQILNYLKFKQTDTFVPSSIGRLDKGTSGLIVYAKNYPALRQLKEKQSNFIKTYTFKSDLPSSITTNYKLKHDELKRREIVDPEGKPSKTEFIVNSRRKEAILHTGRKHQIRASLSKLGYPIYGDVKYGGKKAERIYLHSTSLVFKGLEGDLKYLNNTEIVNKVPF